MIKTRIASSPTGPLHIGTTRTALFNFLFARKKGGEFILRFEDTDQSRSTKESEQDIIEGLKWLGLEWDEGPFRQMERLEIYGKYRDELIKKGLAYEKDKAIYFRSQIPNSKVQSNSKFQFEDLIHGKVGVPVKTLEDFVIVKSDGIPTFLFANMVDDHEMEITHVIRGEDHLPNTPKQLLLYQALGWKPPFFAHIPLILNPDHSKMSKRQGATAVKEFKEAGYLPEAMLNFLALLGWNPKTEQVFFVLDELIETFDLKGIQQGGAVFDEGRLNFFNRHYLREKSEEEILRISNIEYRILDKNYLKKIIRLVKERMTTLKDFEKFSRYFFEEPKLSKEVLIFSKSDVRKTKRGLEKTIEAIEKIEGETNKKEKLNKLLLAVVKENNLSNGDVFWPVRAALSGEKASPSPEELLEVLGKEKSLLRLNAAVKIL